MTTNISVSDNPDNLQVGASTITFNHYPQHMHSALTDKAWMLTPEFGIYASSIPYHATFVTTLSTNQIQAKIANLTSTCTKARAIPSDYAVHRDTKIQDGDPSTVILSCDWRTAPKDIPLTKFVVEAFQGESNDFNPEMQSIIQSSREKLFNQQHREAKKIRTDDRVGLFEKEYSFLSNFFDAPIKWNNSINGRSENIYQLKKFLPENRDHIKASLPKDLVGNPVMDTFEDFQSYMLRISAKASKRLGGKLQKHARPDRDWIKIDFMIALIYLKFTQNSDLREKLVATNDAFLIEGGHDRFWGVSHGEGTNYLGKILMIIRDIIKEEVTSRLNVHAGY